MQRNDLRERTKQFALRVIRLYTALPRTQASQLIGRQVLRSGTSPDAHYREGCRARSTAEFISKMEGGLQELDETGYWLELLVDSGMVAAERVADLRQEDEELIRIFTAIVRKAKLSGATKKRKSSA